MKNKIGTQDQTRTQPNTLTTKVEETERERLERLSRENKEAARVILARNSGDRQPTKDDEPQQQLSHLQIGLKCLPTNQKPML